MTIEFDGNAPNNGSLAQQIAVLNQFINPASNGFITSTQAALAAIGVATTLAGTAKQINIAQASGTATFSTPQNIDTAADVVFRSSTSATLSPTNLPAASISATTGLGVGGAILQQPQTGNSPRFAAAIVSTAGTPAAGEMFRLTFPSNIQPATGAATYVGTVRIINAATGAVVGGTITAVSGTVVAANSQAALTTGTTYQVIVELFPY